MGQTRAMPPRASLGAARIRCERPFYQHPSSSLRQNAGVDERALHGVKLRLACLGFSLSADLLRLGGGKEVPR